MIAKLKNLLERAETWPETDQQELVEAASEIEARRTGVYRLSDDERAEIRAGLAEADRGEFASDEEMASVWKRCGL
jgi:predicted transcriptional regulator